MRKLNFLIIAFISLFFIGLTNVKAGSFLYNPTGLEWKGKIASWQSVTGASSYQVVLTDGVTTLFDDVVTTTRKDFTSLLTDSTKSYTFSVTAKSAKDGVIDSRASTVDSAYYFSDFDINDYPKLKKAVTNGLTLNSIEPTVEQSQWMMTIVGQDLIDQDSDYNAIGMCYETASKCTFEYYEYVGERGINVYETTIDVKYNKPLDKYVTLGNSLAKTMNDGTHDFSINDLYALNFYASAKSTSKNGQPLYSNIIKFSKDLISLTEGKNVTFRLPAGAGEGTPLYSTTMGEAVMYYNNYALALVSRVSVTAKNIIYVPTGTTNYLTEAQARIDKYFGKGKVTITKYKSVSDYTTELANEYTPLSYAQQIIDSSTDGLTFDNNIYNVKINNVDYKFIIAETNEKLETPKYLGSTLAGNGKVTSDSASVPLDSLLSINEVNTDKYNNLITSKMYGAYDISLYSNSKESNITKLTDGKFMVSIKVDPSLNGKTIIAYYKTEDGKLEEYSAKVENEYATFVTGHFSEYVLADSMTTNPATGDNIIKYILLGLVSLIGITIIYIKKIRFN